MNSIYLLNSKIGCDYYKSAKMAILDFCKELERPLQHNHELLILTCYVDLDLILAYVQIMIQDVKVSKVSILFDFSEVYRIGPTKVNGQIRTICEKLEKKGIVFEYGYLFSSSLSHCKGYAVVQKDCYGQVIGGFSFITSANFTKPGFLGENIELGQISTTKTSVKEFAETFYFLKKKFGKTSLEKEIFKQEQYLFKYALLESGVFLHKWAGNLKQELSIMYNLTEQAQKTIKNGVPFDLSTNSFSLGKRLMRLVIDVDSLPEKLIPRSFITSYTIETFWGRWCPKEAWNYLMQCVNPKIDEGGKSKFDFFLKEFKEKTADSVLTSLQEEAKPIQQDLIENGNIIPVDDDHLEKWAKKVSLIRDDGEKRLERFFLGYEKSELPYTIDQKQSVESLYKNLIESMEISRTENRAREKVRKANESYDFNFLDMVDDDFEFIKKITNAKNSKEDDENDG